MRSGILVVLSLRLLALRFRRAILVIAETTVERSLNRSPRRSLRLDVIEHGIAHRQIKRANILHLLQDAVIATTLHKVINRHDGIYGLWVNILLARPVS